MKQDIRSTNSNFLLVLFFISTFALAFYVIDWGFIKGSITEYPIQCPADYLEGNGCYTLGTTTYYPDSKTQTVRMKTEFEIQTLKKCSVINRTNWECKYNDESATFGFISGKYHNITLKAGLAEEFMKKMDLEIHYGSRLEYLLEQWNLR